MSWAILIALAFASCAIAPGKKDAAPVDIPRGYCLVIYNDRHSRIVTVGEADWIEDHDPNFLTAACNIE